MTLAAQIGNLLGLGAGPADYATHSRPSSSFGYTSGGGSEIPLVSGQGSGYGQASYGAGQFREGQGPTPGDGWHPTVIYLHALILAELVGFFLLGRLAGVILGD